MTAPLDLAGKSFGRLTAISRAPNDRRNKAVWFCSCSCGNTTAVNATDLRYGNTKSCGCLKRQRSRENFSLGPDTLRTHGMSRTRVYKRWGQMIARCYKPNHPRYKDWGGRGITVCPEWRHSFVNFIADMGMPPPGRSLDRIDNDGPYCKANCRWSTPVEQMLNTRARKLKTPPVVTLLAVTAATATSLTTPAPRFMTD
jgi:hypothetical protein